MTSLERKVCDVFKRNDLFVTLDDAMGYFPGESRWQVEAALESLCRQGKLYSSETFMGKMYGYDSTEYCLADDRYSVDMNSGEGIESIINALGGIQRETYASRVNPAISQQRSEVCDIDDPKFLRGDFTEKTAQEWVGIINLHMEYLNEVKSIIGKALVEEAQQTMYVLETFKIYMKPELKVIAEYRSTYYAKVAKVIDSNLAGRISDKDVRKGINNFLGQLISEEEEAVTVNGANRFGAPIPDVKKYRSKFTGFKNETGTEITKKELVQNMVKVLTEVLHNRGKDELPWRKDNVVEKSISFGFSGYSSEQRTNLINGNIKKNEQHNKNVMENAEKLKALGNILKYNLSAENILKGYEEWLTEYDKLLEDGVTIVNELTKSSLISAVALQTMSPDRIFESHRVYLSNMADYVEKVIITCIDQMKTISAKYKDDDKLIDIYNTLLKVCQKNVFSSIINGKVISASVKNIDALAMQFKTPEVEFLMNLSPEEKAARAEKKMEEQYVRACAESDKKDDIDAQKKAAEMFKELGSYKDCEQLQEECNKTISELTKKQDYDTAMNLLGHCSKKYALTEAQKMFNKLGEYSDSRDKSEQATILLEQIVWQEKVLREYEDAMARYQRSFEERDREIEVAVRKKMKDMKTAAEEELTGKHNREMDSLTEKQKRYKVEYENEIQKLSNLGLFKAKERKQCKENIVQLNEEIKTLGEIIYKLKENYADNFAAITDQIEKQEQKIRAEISAQIPYAEEPEKPEIVKDKEKTEEKRKKLWLGIGGNDAKDKRIILETLSKHGGLTISSIISHSDNLSKYSIQHVLEMIGELVKSKLAVKIVIGNNEYFDLPE